MPADPADQILTVLSALPLTRRVPSLLNATDQTEPEWPVREHSCSPEAASQIKTVLSSLPLAILVPSGEKHTDFTKSLLKTTKSVLIYKRRHSAQGNGTHLCPLRCGRPRVRVHRPAPLVDRHDPEVMSHILMVLSAEQLARMLGFWGSKATQNTHLLLTNNKSELKLSWLLKNTKSQEKAFYARKWDVPVPPHRALRVD